MSILKMAASQSAVTEYKEPEMVDKAISGALIGIPGSVAYSSAKNYTQKVLKPENFTKRKALKSFGKTMTVGTGLTLATTPVRNMLDNINQSVGESALNINYNNVKSQKEYDDLRERATTAGAGLTAGTAGSLIGGPIIGIGAGMGAAQQTYLNEKLESNIRQKRQKLTDDIKERFRK